MRSIIQILRRGKKPRKKKAANAEANYFRYNDKFEQLEADVRTFFDSIALHTSGGLPSNLQVVSLQIVFVKLFHIPKFPI